MPITFVVTVAAEVAPGWRRLHTYRHTAPDLRAFVRWLAGAAHVVAVAVAR